MSRALHVAILTPSVVLGAWWAVSRVGGPAFVLPWPWAFALWCALTLPSVVALLAAPRERAPEHDRDVRKAIEAVARAEQMLESHAARLASGARSTSSRPGWAVVASAFVFGALLMGAGWVLAANAPWSSEPPIHIHATFAVFAEGERIAFSDAHYDLSARRYLHAHLHAPNQDVLHIEGPGRLSLQQIFARGLDASFGPAGLVLHGPVHAERELAPDQARIWRLRVAADGGDAWIEVARPWEYEPADHDRLLLSLAAPDAQLVPEQAIVSRAFPPEG